MAKQEAPVLVDQRATELIRGLPVYKPYRFMTAYFHNPRKSDARLDFEALTKALMKVAIMLLLWCGIAQAGYTDRKYIWTVPCVQADSFRCDTVSAVAETTLKEVRFWAVRFRDNDTLYLGAKPLRLRGCYTDSILATWLNGSMFEVLQKHVDQAGNLACHYSHFVDVVPADSTWNQDPFRPQGLSAQYWDNDDFTGETVTAIDSLVDFAGGAWPMSVAPIPSGTIGPSIFSAQWAGFINIPTAGSWSFCVDSDDGARLWVGNSAIMDRWSATGRGKSCGSATLSAGVLAIKLDYHQNGGSSFVRLLWTPPNGLEEVVPATALSH